MALTRAAWVGLAALVCGCGDKGSPTAAGTDGEPTAGDPSGMTAGDTSGGDTEDAPACGAMPTLSLSGAASVHTEEVAIAPGERCSWQLDLAEARVVELTVTAAEGSTVALDQEDEPGWRHPTLFPAGTHSVDVTHAGTEATTVELTVRDHGPEMAAVERTHSLVWTQPALTEPPDACTLACVMGRIAADGHGGRMLAAWFDRWAKTSHSQRFGPRQLLEAYASALGSDPTAWDLDALPFVVTAVHNRIDLAREGHCGELRVSLASTDPLYRPLHLIFLFRQSAQPDDLSPHGTAHCVATARRWAHLSSLAEDEMLAEVAASVDRLFTAQAFLAAESVEFVTSPWEWRQWFPVDNPDPTSAEELPIALDNPGMFQTVDIPRLNAPGPDREEFLAFVAAEAAGLDARTVAIPADFTPPSARLNQGVPWQPLSLQGLDTQMLAEYPNLRGNIEIVGCPACHATDAEFVHTLPDRTFSPFYERELDARAEHLLARINGEVREPAPFGPLQDDPALPP